MQVRRNSSVLAMELRLSYIKLLTYSTAIRASECKSDFELTTDTP